MKNICKIQAHNRTKLQQLNMLMQYDNAGNIHGPKFQNISRSVFNLQSLYEARFSKLYKSPRPCAFSTKLKPASQSVTQILIFVLALEQRSRNHKHRMKREM